MKKVLIANTSGLGVGGITTHMLNYISHTKSEYEYTVISTMYHQESVIGAFKKLGCTVIDMPDRKKNLLGYWFAIYSLMKKNAYAVTV